MLFDAKQGSTRPLSWIHKVNQVTLISNLSLCLSFSGYLDGLNPSNICSKSRAFELPMSTKKPVISQALVYKL